jgi:hypothetical protein
MENEREEKKIPSKRIWVTPQVIVSEQPVKGTENQFGGGFDGGTSAGTTHS